jgi:hypothetical protein
MQFCGGIITAYGTPLLYFTTLSQFRCFCPENVFKKDLNVNKILSETFDLKNVFYAF